MDNASKALIMAGAILISIAIVGVGVFIFSSTSNVGETGSAYMDTTQTQTLNSTLSKYAGSRTQGASVKSMIEYIDVVNTNNVFPVKIVYTIDGVSGDASSIIPSAYYTVTLEDLKPTSNDGYYDTVTITKN